MIGQRSDGVGSALRRAHVAAPVALCVVLAVSLLAACTEDSGPLPAAPGRDGVVASWVGPAVDNGPTPEATAVLLRGGEPAVVHADGSELRVLRPDGDRLAVRRSVDLRAPVVFFVPRVAGDRLVVLTQTCPTPLSTVDSTARDCPGALTSLVTFSGPELDVDTVDVELDGIPHDLAVLEGTEVLTTSTGLDVHHGDGEWTRVDDVIGGCVIDGAAVGIAAPTAAEATTTTASDEPTPTTAIALTPLDGAAVRIQELPGRVSALTCAPGGYLASAFPTAGVDAGASFLTGTSTAAPAKLDGPGGTIGAIGGQLSTGQWATATQGTRRTVFVDPMSGDWFAAKGMKRAASPPYATSIGGRGVVLSPEPGGGRWTLRSFPIER